MRREAFLALLGELPEACPPEVERLETIDCGAYFREKLAYNVAPGERIHAYLLLPKGMRAAAPAVFCHHQHNREYLIGKGEVVGLLGNEEQAYARELALRGYVTLAPDAPCFEERADRRDPAWFHHHLMKNLLIEGRTLLGKLLHEISVGISVLQARPEVDRERIGFIGHSYGGRTALFAPAFDRRLRVAVSSCGCTSFRRMLAHDTGIQPDFCVPGFLRHGDIEDVVRLAEPASLLILAATHDRWSLGAREMYEAARSAFREGELACLTFEATHRFTPEMKGAAYAFLDRHLEGGR